MHEGEPFGSPSARAAAPAIPPTCSAAGEGTNALALVLECRREVLSAAVLACVLVGELLDAVDRDVADVGCALDVDQDRDRLDRAGRERYACAERRRCEGVGRCPVRIDYWGDVVAPEEEQAVR